MSVHDIRTRETLRIMNEVSESIGPKRVISTRDELMMHQRTPRNMRESGMVGSIYDPSSARRSLWRTRLRVILVGIAVTCIACSVWELAR